jgi:hypothetical protein
MARVGDPVQPIEESQFIRGHTCDSIDHCHLFDCSGARTPRKLPYCITYSLIFMITALNYPAICPSACQYVCTAPLLIDDHQYQQHSHCVSSSTSLQGPCAPGTPVWETESCNPQANAHVPPIELLFSMLSLPLYWQVMPRHLLLSYDS